MTEAREGSEIGGRAIAPHPMNRKCRRPMHFPAQCRSDCGALHPEGLQRKVIVTFPLGV